MTSHVIGAQPATTLTATEAQQGGKSFALGDRYTNYDHKEYVYCQATTAVTANFLVSISELYAVAMLGTANDAYGTLVGVPEVAIAAASFGWVQIKGPALIQVLASAAANVRLNTTATPGALDDDATAGAFPVSGVYLTAARAASPGTALAVLNYPQQGVVL